jgi:hypothetical protein
MQFDTAAPYRHRLYEARHNIRRARERAMDGDDISRLDDFEVLAERQRVIAALTALTDNYRRLNDEMTHRETLRWMLQP